METTTWHGCYDDGWKGMIVDDAFAHPAKMAYGLLTRIVRRMVDEGWVEAGQTVGDPFGGIGTGGIVSAYYGLHWVGVELEPRFVELAGKNFAMHRPRWLNLPGCAEPRIINGDSRRFAELVGEAAAVVTSPPYAESLNANKESVDDKIALAKASGATAERATWGANKGSSGFSADAYGTTPGQIGALREGRIDSVITSPPFLDARSDTTRSTPTTHGGDCQERHHTVQSGAGYGDTPGQIGDLPAGTLSGVMTSPPYEGSDQDYKAGFKRFHANGKAFTQKTNAIRDAQYGDTDGQIGNTAGDTYWQAMHAVYGQMHLAMKAGAVAAIVVKDYVKAGKRVPLCDDTCTLLTHLGFDVFERTRAMLVKRDEHPGLFDEGEAVVKTKERKSFFRRLAEKKGSPPIDWEEVIWCRKETP